MEWRWPERRATADLRGHVAPWETARQASDCLVMATNDVQREAQLGHRVAQSRFVIKAAAPSAHEPQLNWGGLIKGKHGPSGTNSEIAAGW